MKVQIVAKVGKSLIAESSLAKTKEDALIFEEGFRLGWQGAVKEIMRRLDREEKENKKRVKR